MKTRTEHLLDDLSDSETLTESEFEWVDKMMDFYEQHGSLSDKQLEVLEKIYREDHLRL
jgi:ribosome assembly protein YihI (activator of Der GTPase)